MIDKLFSLFGKIAVLGVVSFIGYIVVLGSSQNSRDGLAFMNQTKASVDSGHDAADLRVYKWRCTPFGWALQGQGKSGEPFCHELGYYLGSYYQSCTTVSEEPPVQECKIAPKYGSCEPCESGTVSCGNAPDPEGGVDQINEQFKKYDQCGEIEYCGCYKEGERYYERVCTPEGRQLQDTPGDKGNLSCNEWLTYQGDDVSLCSTKTSVLPDRQCNEIGCKTLDLNADGRNDIGRDIDTRADAVQPFLDEHCGCVQYYHLDYFMVDSGVKYFIIGDTAHRRSKNNRKRECGDDYVVSGGGNPLMAVGVCKQTIIGFGIAKEDLGKSIAIDQLDAQFTIESVDSACE